LAICDRLSAPRDNLAKRRACGDRSARLFGERQEKNIKGEHAEIVFAVALAVKEFNRKACPEPFGYAQDKLLRRNWSRAKIAKMKSELFWQPSVVAFLLWFDSI